MTAPESPRRVCVVGSINMDLVIRAPRFPDAGETILGGEFATFPGGKGANQAVAAARMGAKVSMIGRVGDDAYGVEMRRVLDAEGIDTTAVLTTRGTPTGVAVITVAEGGGNTIVVAPGANGKVTPADVEAARDKIEAADVVLMQLEVPLDAVARAAEIAKSAGRIVMLNAAPAAELPANLRDATEVIIVNETEAAIVAKSVKPGSLRNLLRDPIRETPRGPEKVPESSQELRRLLEQVAGLAPTTFIVTLGADGAAWVADGNARMVEAFRVNAVDTVGAGDAFCGALAAHWRGAMNIHPGERFTVMFPGREGGTAPSPESFLEHTDALLKACDHLKLACAAGALATIRRGAIPSLPTLRAVNFFLDTYTRPERG